MSTNNQTMLLSLININVLKSVLRFFGRKKMYSRERGSGLAEHVRFDRLRGECYVFFFYLFIILN